MEQPAHVYDQIQNIPQYQTASLKLEPVYPNHSGPNQDPQINGLGESGHGQKRHADHNQGQFVHKRQRTENYSSHQQNKTGFQNRHGKVDLRILLPSKVNFSIK